jgi:hypothetical protein
VRGQDLPLEGPRGYGQRMHEPLPSWHGVTSVHLLVLAALVAALLGWLVSLLG